MVEKRDGRRMSLTAQLFIKNVNDENDKEEVKIEVLDVSRSGVGFMCSAPLSIGAVYEAQLKIWTDEVIHVFLKIVRIEQTENEEYICGTIFVGMPEINAKKIEIYDLVERIKEGEA
ncbi:PilZ domain-containing protein [Lachnospiraceae bacterium 42-17]|nr:PilZ domain-containing protein [Dorea sp.]